MGVEIPNGYGLAGIRFQCTGVVDPLVTTFGYKYTAVAGVGDPTAHANSIMDKLVTTTGKLLHAAGIFTTYTVLGVTCTETWDDDPHIGVSTTPAVPGTATGEALPVNCAFLVRKTTNLGGRRGRGRMYFPPLFYSEGSVTPAGMVTGALTTVQGRLNTFFGDLLVLDLPMYLLHDEWGGGDFPLPPPPTLVQSLTLQPLLATQRRRMR